MNKRQILRISGGGLIAAATLSSPTTPGPEKKSHDASHAPSRFLCPEDQRCAGRNRQGARRTDFWTWSSR